MADKDKAHEQLLEEVEQVRRGDPDLETQLERYRADREAYDKQRTAQRDVKSAPTPATGRGAAGRPSGPKSSIGRIR